MIVKKNKKKVYKDITFNEIQNFINTNLIIEIGKLIIEKVGKIPELKGNYKKYYEDYIIKIDDDIKFVNEEKDYSKEDKIKMVKELEIERLNVECVFRYLQENKIRLIKQKKLLEE